MSERPPDVEAEIMLLPTSEGGRHAPTFSGYRPHHRVRPDYETTGTHHYLDRDQLMPGETARGTITFITPEAYPNSLRVGDVVEFAEGNRLVGRARIVRVLNPVLERAR